MVVLTIWKKNEENDLDEEELIGLLRIFNQNIIWQFYFQHFLQIFIFSGTFNKYNDWGILLLAFILTRLHMRCTCTITSQIQLIRLIHIRG